MTKYIYETFFTTALQKCNVYLLFEGAKGAEPPLDLLGLYIYIYIYIYIITNSLIFIISNTNFNDARTIRGKYEGSRPKLKVYEHGCFLTFWATL